MNAPKWSDQDHLAVSNLSSSNDTPSSLHAFQIKQKYKINATYGGRSAEKIHFTSSWSHHGNSILNKCRWDLGEWKPRKQVMSQMQRDVHSPGRQDLLGSSGRQHGEGSLGHRERPELLELGGEAHWIRTKEQLKGLSQRICAVKRYGTTAVNKMDSTKVQFRGRETSLDKFERDNHGLK